MSDPSCVETVEVVEPELTTTTLLIPDIEIITATQSGSQGPPGPQGVPGTPGDRGTPGLPGPASTRALWFPNNAGVSVYTPDGAGVTAAIANGFDIRACHQYSSVATAQGIIGVNSFNGWGIRQPGGQGPYLHLSADGVGTNYIFNNYALLGTDLSSPTDGDWICWRVTWSSTTNQVIGYVSSDNGVTWTLKKTSATLLTNTPIFTPQPANQVLCAGGIGQTLNTANVGYPNRSGIAWIDVRTFAGAPVAYIDFQDAWTGTYRDSSARLWSFYGTGTQWMTRTRNLQAPDPRFNVKTFGAVGDGVADDTVALQKTFDAAAANSGEVYVPPGTYRTTSNLWVYRNTDVIGANRESSVILMDAAWARYNLWIGFGASGYQQTGDVTNRWHGTVRNLTFKVSANAAQTGAGAVLSLANVDGAVVRDCIIDVTAVKTAPAWLGIDAQSKGTYMAGTYFRANISLLNNRIIGAQPDTGQTAILLNLVTNVNVSGNYVFGFGGDALAIYDSDKVVVANNRLFPIDAAGITTAAIRGFTLADNYIERIPTQDGGALWKNGSAGIYNQPGTSTQTVTRNGTISGNTILCNQDTAGTTNESGIYVRGIRRVNINGNTIINRTGRSLSYSIYWASAAVASWTDDEGLDPAGTQLTRDVKWFGNQIIGAFNSRGSSTTDSVNVNHDFSPFTQTFQATAPLNASCGSETRMVLTGNVTSSSINNAAVDQRYTVTWIQDGIGGRTVVWPTTCKFAGGAAPVVGAAPNARTSVTFVYDGTNWNEMSRAVGVV